MIHEATPRPVPTLPPRREAVIVVVLAGAALGALVAGWRTFYFLTDDAFIAFRYVGNSLLGHGYVWNPPPFRAVEGYTSPLWVFLLDVVWRLTGSPPPEASNRLALGFGALTLLASGVLIWRACVGRLQPWRVAILGLGLALVVTNRTFLAWTSSGLETAMFDCWLTLWVAALSTLQAGTRPWALAQSAAAALCALTRPDGLLLVVATAGLIGLASLAIQRRGGRAGPLALSGVPLLVVPAHLVWRRATYGEWLPNTLFAKSASNIDRFASGWRYLLSFAIEYGLWIWLAIVGALALRLLIDTARRRPARLDLGRRGAPAIVGCLATHVGYYTFGTGGDHFEFRVYSHLVPLLVASLVWALARLRTAPATALLAMTLWLALAQPIPWLHWAASNRHTERSTTGLLFVPVADEAVARAPATPKWAIAYMSLYDDLQRWLIGHAVGLRHQEHKIFAEAVLATFPDRQTSPPEPRPGIPVRACGSVGIIGYQLAWLNIVDTLGLNDRVIARHPTLSTNQLLGHERQAPPGYLECFSPQLVRTPDATVWLTAAHIERCESSFRP